MFSKVWLMNTILAMLLFSIVPRTIEVWKQKDQFPLKSAVSEYEAKPIQRRPGQRIVKPESAYDPIAEKTLFSENRVEFILEETEAEPDPLQPQDPPQSKSVFLYGVVMAGDYRKALVREDAGGSGKNRWVREGDDVGGMTVASIQKDKLLLSSEQKEQTLLLYDLSKPKNDIALNKEGNPTVITSQTRSADKAGKELEKVNAKENTVLPATEESPNHQPDIKTEDIRKSDEGKENGRIKTNAFKNPLPQLFQMPSGNSSDSRYEIIQTPFGDVKRKIN